MKEKTIVAARQALVFFRLRVPIIRGTGLRVDKEIPCLENRGSRHGWAGSLSALKEIGCKSVFAGPYFADFSTNGTTIGLQNRQNLSLPTPIFLRFFKSDRLPAQRISRGNNPLPIKV